MRKIDILTLLIIASLFFVILYEKKLNKGQGTGESASQETPPASEAATAPPLNGDEEVSAIAQKIMSGGLEKAFLEDDNAKPVKRSEAPFHSKFSYGPVEEFVTDRSRVHTVKAMIQDIDIKLQKLNAELLYEQERFRKEKDAFGVDRAEYEALKKKHARLYSETVEKNKELLRELRVEHESAKNSGLR